MILSDLLALLSVPSAVDACVRLRLLVASRGAHHAEPPARPVDDWVVVIPSRAEGWHLDDTLASIETTNGRANVDVIVVLDGEDEESRLVAGSRGARVAVKMPAGPGKGAALGWFMRQFVERVERADAVLVLDVGSRLPVGFFARFSWPIGADAVQCYLTGEGREVGEAIARSESIGQAIEDRGRERIGWNVRLRGTGCAFTPEAFRRSTESLVTQVEDLEASLVLTCEGSRIMMGPRDLGVVDVKPVDIQSAAAQRGRWLWGTLILAFRRAGLIVRLVVRKPGEGLAFLAQILGRPLSLSVPLRLIAAVLLLAIGNDPIRAASSAFLLLTVAADIAISSAYAQLRPASVVKLFLAWILALPMMPRAAYRWLRAKRKS